MLPLLALTPGSWRLIGGGLLIVGFLGWVAYERQHLINQGAQEATQKIEEANDKAKQKADAGSQSVDGCFATGGVWDREHGVCDHRPGQ